MPIEEIISRRISGIDPFNDLPIDADIWREAHEHHHLHRRLHAAAMHRPGIVYGLEVVVADQKKAELVIAPGLAIDGEGRAMRVDEPQRMALGQESASYIVLKYIEEYDARSKVRVSSGERPYRRVEGFDIAAEASKSPGAIELARVDRTGSRAPVRPAQDPLDPGEDELSLLFRSLAFPHCYADGVVGEVCLLPKADPAAWKPNRPGLVALLRAANGLGFHVDYAGLANLRAIGAPDPLLLYASAAGDFKPPTDEQTEGLRRYLLGGGTFFAEASGGSPEFAEGLRTLAERMGFKLSPIVRGAPLLSAHVAFSAPPPGAKEGGLWSDPTGAFVMGDGDLGAAWSGRIDGLTPVAARERSRTAVDLGLNLLVHANARKRAAYLAQIV